VLIPLYETRLLILLHVNKLYHTCNYICHPEDEPLGLKHVEHIVKIKILVQQRFILLVYIIQLYYIPRCKKHKSFTALCQVAQL